MQELPKGGNSSIPNDQVTLTVSWQPDALQNQPLAVAALLLDAQQKTRSDADVVHVGASQAPGVGLSQASGSASFAVNFSALPPGTERVVVTAHHPIAGGNLGSLSTLDAQIPGSVVYRMDAADRSGEALALCELYLRKGEWKFRALGAGKAGGIQAVLAGYGASVNLSPSAAAPPPAPAPSAPPPMSPPPASGGGGINLNKISLEKKGDQQTINLDKQKLNQEILINLNWTGAAKKKKLFSLKRGIDLDLGAFFEMKDGGKMCIDGLQFSNAGGPRNVLTRQGCYTEMPYIWHTGDDRSGSQMAEGENILINPAGFKDFKRVHIYCYIYEGAAKWVETNAVITIKVPGNPDLEVAMGQERSRLTFCLIASLDFLSADSVRVTRHMSFHPHHGAADNIYGWGMKWGAGSK